MQDGKHVILCVDDDPDFLEAMQLILEASGYVMAPAASAEEARKIYKQVNPDLLIVDLMMEEVDAGTALVTDLKALGNTAPIYMLSSVGDGLSLSADYSQLGLAGIFQKPIDNDMLLRTLKTKLKK